MSCTSRDPASFGPAAVVLDKLPHIGKRGSCSPPADIDDLEDSRHSSAPCTLMSRPGVSSDHAELYLATSWPACAVCMIATPNTGQGKHLVAQIQRNPRP